jgi:hypothetical protein
VLENGTDPVEPCSAPVLLRCGLLTAGLDGPKRHSATPPDYRPLSYGPPESAPMLRQSPLPLSLWAPDAAGKTPSIGHQRSLRAVYRYRPLSYALSSPVLWYCRPLVCGSIVPCLMVLPSSILWQISPKTRCFNTIWDANAFPYVFTAFSTTGARVLAHQHSPGFCCCFPVTCVTQSSAMASQPVALIVGSPQVLDPPTPKVRLERNLNGLGFFTATYKASQSKLHRVIELGTIEIEGKRTTRRVEIVGNERWGGLPSGSDRDKYYAFMTIVNNARKTTGLVENGDGNSGRVLRWGIPIDERQQVVRARGVGFSRYFGTAYGDLVVGDYMTEAVFPALFHQGPRYFRKGTASKWSRLGYAMGQIFWTHRDSGGTQFNYSEVMGNSVAVAISNGYYADNRTARDAASKLGMQLGVDTAANILKEFWPEIERKLRRKRR